MKYTLGLILGAACGAGCQDYTFVYVGDIPTENAFECKCTCGNWLISRTETFPLCLPNATVAGMDNMCRQFCAAVAGYANSNYFAADCSISCSSSAGRDYKADKCDSLIAHPAEIESCGGPPVDDDSVLPSNFDTCNVIIIGRSFTECELVEPLQFIRAPDGDPPALHDGPFSLFLSGRRLRAEIGDGSKMDIFADGEKIATKPLAGNMYVTIDLPAGLPRGAAEAPLGAACESCVPLGFGFLAYTPDFVARGRSISDTGIVAGLGERRSIWYSLGSDTDIPAGEITAAIAFTSDGVPMSAVRSSIGPATFHFDGQSVLLTTALGITDKNGHTLTFVVSIAATVVSPGPFVSAPRDFSAECNGPNGASVALDASVQSPGKITRVAWYATDPKRLLNSVSNSWYTASVHVATDLPLGIHDLWLESIDDSLRTTAARTTATVVDTASPALSQVPGPVDREATCESRAPNGERLTYTHLGLPSITDTCDPWPVVTSSAPGELFALGTTTVTFAGRDSVGNATSASTTVTLRDTTPPRLDVAYQGPICLSPPNHKYAVVRLGDNLIAAVADACDPSPRVAFVSATSTQPDDGTGDGSTTQDVVVFDDHLCIRSERQGNIGAAREYMVTLRATDKSGNTSDSRFAIRVAHDQRADDCPHLTPAALVDDTDPSCTAALGQQSSQAGTLNTASGDSSPAAGKHRAASCAQAQGLGSAWLFSLLLLALRRRRPRYPAIRAVLRIAVFPALTAVLALQSCSRNPQDAGAWSGKVDRRQFAVESSRTRRDPHSALHVELADFEMACGTLQPDGAGARMVDVVLGPEYQRAGTFSLGDLTTSTTVGLAVTVWQEIDAHLVPVTSVVTAGSVTIESVDPTGVSGTIHFRLTGEDVSGRFASKQCP